MAREVDPAQAFVRRARRALAQELERAARVALEHVHVGATANIIGVTANNGCTWSVVKTNTWITITAGQSGNGNGQVNYSVDLNSGVADRTAVLVLEGASHMPTEHPGVESERHSCTSWPWRSIRYVTLEFTGANRT